MDLRLWLLILPPVLRSYNKIGFFFFEKDQLTSWSSWYDFIIAKNLYFCGGNLLISLQQLGYLKKLGLSPKGEHPCSYRRYDILNGIRCVLKEIRSRSSTKVLLCRRCNVDGSLRSPLSLPVILQTPANYRLQRSILLAGTYAFNLCNQKH